MAKRLVCLVVLVFLGACGDESAVEVQREPTDTGALVSPPTTEPPVAVPSSLPLVDASSTGEDGDSSVIDGVVIDQNGDRLSGATVSLLHSPMPTGEFTLVPEGSELIAQLDRANPISLTDQGTFALAIQPGRYKLTAESEGCFALEGPPPQELLDMGFTFAFGDPGSTIVETDLLIVPPANSRIIFRLDCDRPAMAPLVLQALVPEDSDLQGEMVVDVSCELDGQTTTSGPHSGPINGDIEIPDLPVNSDCAIEIQSLPDGVLPTPGIFDVGIMEDGNVLEFYLYTGQTPDDLLIGLGSNSRSATHDDAEARVVADCTDGSAFDTTVKMYDRVLLSPIAFGAICTVTLTSPNLDIDPATQTTTVTNITFGHEPRSEDERDNPEWGDLEFIAR